MKTRIIALVCGAVLAIACGPAHAYYTNLWTGTNSVFTNTMRMSELNWIELGTNMTALTNTVMNEVRTRDILLTNTVMVRTTNAVMLDVVSRLGSVAGLTLPSNAWITSTCSAGWTWITFNTANRTNTFVWTNSFSVGQP
jgi:hypothetical protein